MYNAENLGENWGKVSIILIFSNDNCTHYDIILNFGEDAQCTHTEKNN